jgi:hypothetical protein
VASESRAGPAKTSTQSRASDNAAAGAGLVGREFFRIGRSAVNVRIKFLVKFKNGHVK